MASTARLTELVQDDLTAFLDARRAELAEIAPELAAIADEAEALLAGGKRFRARFCYWGWRAVAGVPDGLDPMSASAPVSDLESVIGAAAAIELLHAAALVHDDIIDRSSTRRGRAATHAAFATRHREGGWVKDPDEFGRSAALLVGDLLLGWSGSRFDTAVDGLSDPAWARAARAEFERMRQDVTVGQYLDILEEHAWIAGSDADAAARAHRVIVYKSAKYSVEAPLVIGALLGGASEAQVASLRDAGVPLGVAFQLRDDLLGVYGDPAATGKPAGDDLREGKRTVLVALARQALPGSARSLVDEMLGDPELDDEQVALLARTLRECGAVDQVERAIEYNVRRAVDAIRDARVASTARGELLALADAVARRSA